MAWNKIKITRDNGDKVDAQAPVIVSASRSTDIPAFYCDWFFNRLKAGYSAWINPFNGVKSYVAYDKTRFIVFWSKNPAPLLPYLEDLKVRGIGCYIQYTLNDYEKEGLEQGVSSVDSRISTFKQLVDRLGQGSVVWRFDPMILTDKITIDDLLAKVEYIGDQLKGYNEKLVFSFADITSYKKVKTNLDRNGINYVEWTEDLMIDFAKRLSELNKKWGYELATCGEQIDIEQFGIKHNHCVDDELIIRKAYRDAELMKFLGVELHTRTMDLFGESEIPDGAMKIDDVHYAIKHKDMKDKGQRMLCGCMVAKDIGQYNTCPHQCEYCYANSSKETAITNYKRHKANIHAETITGI